MARKPRERELTKEEAIEQARVQLTPFWISSPPLLAGAKGPQGSQVFPIDDSFLKKAWLIFMMDPAGGAAEDHLRDWKEIVRRYKPYDLEFLCIMRSPFGFYRQAGVLESMVSQSKLPEVISLDPDGALIDALKPPQADLPFVILMDRGMVLGTAKDSRWIEDLEPQLHTYLRKADPGLALLSPIVRDTPAYRDLHEWNLVAMAGDAKKPFFPSKAFPVDGERLLIEDEKATIRFTCEGEAFSIVAESLDPNGRPADILVELNGANPRENLWAADLGRNEMGLASVRVLRPRLYLALQNLPSGPREITLKFPSSERAKVGLYGIRIAGTVPS